MSLQVPAVEDWQPRPEVTVIIPVFDHATFLPRAVGCLLAQELETWEAVVIDDGSADEPLDVLASVTDDPRIRAVGWPMNRGLGATLNAGLELATAPLVAYLPADDVWFGDHLSALVAHLEQPSVTLAWSGLLHHDGQQSLGPPDGFSLQLVQAAHRRNHVRWTERAEMESDDLDLLMWDRLRSAGSTAATERVTCGWTDHPHQRHKMMRQRFDGGLNVFRSRYAVAEPLRFHSTDSGLTDEIERYSRFRKQSLPPSPDGLTILLVGELAFNPERVLALSERGHRLHGLWTSDGLGDSSVGPLPFGHVADLPREGWQDAVRRLRPDVVYALLNWRAVPFAHAVQRAHPELPFVWHFKESPQRSIVRGEWPLLAELVCAADACLFSTREERDWFLAALPGRLDPNRVHVLDGDMPKADWLDAPASAKRSDLDGEPHTVVVGRPSGFDLNWVLDLTARGIHVHLYGQVDAPGPKGSWRHWWDDAARGASDRLHLHPAVGPEGWVPELSTYDAGWLHRFDSANEGEIRRAVWDDLNSPARLPVLLAAGLPPLQKTNPGHIVAVDRILRDSGTGLLYADADDLAAQLREEMSSRQRGRAAWAVRHENTFDAHADRLLAILGDAVARGPQRRRTAGGALQEVRPGPAR